MNRLVREKNGQFRTINGYGQKADHIYRRWEIRFHRQVSSREIGDIWARTTAGVYIGHISIYGLDFETMTYPSMAQVARAIDAWWIEMGHRYGWKEADCDRATSIFK